MFSPSLYCEASTVSIRGSFPVATMAPADFLAHRNRIYSKTYPGKSFFLLPIPEASTKERLLVRGFAMMWLLTLSLSCLMCIFCSSVQVFVVLLPSVKTSLLTTLQLTNWLHQLASKGLTPSEKKTSHTQCKF